MATGGVNWLVGVMASRRNTPTLHRTLESLAEAGWSEVLVHWDAERAGPAAAFLRLLEALANQAQPTGLPTWCVVFPDDVRATDGLREGLEGDLAMPWDGVVSLYAPAAIQRKPVIRWGTADRLPYSVGGAFAFPLILAQVLVAQPQAIDKARMPAYLVAEFCAAQNVPYYLPGVSFVRRIGDLGRSDNQPYQQCRYYLPVLGGPIEEITAPCVG
jgi:hypothetical protein